MLFEFSMNSSSKVEGNRFLSCAKEPDGGQSIEQQAYETNSPCAWLKAPSARCVAVVRGMHGLVAEQLPAHDDRTLYRLKQSMSENANDADAADSLLQEPVEQSSEQQPLQVKGHAQRMGMRQLAQFRDQATHIKTDKTILMNSPWPHHRTPRGDNDSYKKPVTSGHQIPAGAHSITIWCPS